ncbi:filamin-B [Polymixia lowei]
MFCTEREVSPGLRSVCSAACNLADDAPWKKIQKNTFTRWCNEHLRRADRVIDDLRFDLNDGLTLIALLEVLSHKKISRKYHTRPTFRQMRLDNVSVALEFLEQENIKLVSIDSKAIVDGNMKLILGLVWTLILHYSISSSLLEEEEAKKQTPELRLLGWIQDKVPELPITNFSQDWMDGKALGALVDGLAPGLCPDWESWDEVQRVDNAREAMQQAAEWLGVPQVIAPEEIIDPSVDELSIMTYLSMFPKAQLKPGAPLKPKSVSKPKVCRASGRGLQPRGVREGQVADFKVDTSKAGPGHLEVHVRGPDGFDVPVKQKQATGDVYSFQYEPNVPGMHTISIMWAGEHIFKSPFEVGVGPKAGPQMIRAWGPGLVHGMAEMSADFVVESTGANFGLLGFAIEGPSQARIECGDQEDGSCNVRFWPTKTGEYAVHVMCDEEEIQDSPFMSYISPNKKKCYPHKVKVFGPGVSQNGFILNSLMEFTVDARFAGHGSLGIQAQSIEGRFVDVAVMRKEHGLYTCFYTPATLTKHTVFVTWGGVSVPGSPFRVKAYGPGLEGGLVGTLAAFTIDTNDSGCGQLSVTVDGPCPTKIMCSDNQDGTCTVTYLPTENGEHSINIFFQGLHIPGSPFHVDIQAPFDLSKVVVSGPGLKTGKVGEPCVVNIDCALAGLGDLSVEAVSESGQPANAKVQANKDGTYTVVYVPLTAGVYTLRLKYGGKLLANFPSEVIVDPAIYTSQVKICGNGADAEGVGEQNHFEGEQNPASAFAKGIGLLQGLTGESKQFTITKRGRGAGGLSVSAEGPSDAKVSCPGSIDGVYDVQYSPSVPGLYNVNVTCGGEHVQGKIEVVEVKDNCDGTYSMAYSPSVEGDHCLVVKYTDDQAFSRYVLGFQTFTIDCSKNGEAPETVAVMTPDGKMELVEVTDNRDGTYSVVYSPSMEGKMGLAEVMDRDGTYSLAYSPSVEGDHSLVVTRADEDDYVSSYQLQVLPNDSNSEVKISVPELESRICAQIPQTFTIDCSKTGEPPQSVAIMTPSGVTEVVKVADNGDGTYSVAYSPSVEGAHSLTVRYADEEEFSILSNFRVLPTNDTNKLNVCGPGLEMGLCAKVPQTFSIDCSKTGGAPESVAVMTPNGKMELVEVIDNRDGTYSMAYSPSMEGVHSLVVKYSDEDEFCSPYQFQVLSGDSNREVKVSVPGPEAGVCAQIPQTFTIDCNKTGEAPETVAVMTPSGKMEISEVIDNGDGTYSVAFFPSMEGAHSVMVKYNDDEDFYCFSSFNVLPIDDVNKLKVSAPGLESGLCEEGPQSFTNDCSKIEEAPGSVALNTPSGKMELSEVTDNENVISPTMEGSQSVMVKYANEEDVYSPHNFQALLRNDNGKVEISVPELESGFCAQIPQTFTIDCSKTGETPQAVAIMTPSGQLKFLEVTDNGNGTYSVAYSPTMNGAHLIMVKYAEEAEFNSSSSFQVVPTSGIKELKVSGPGLESGLCVKLPQTFTIGCSNTGGAPESVAVITPSGKMELVEVSDNRDGTYSVAYSPSKEGAHSLVVKYAEEEQFYSPYNFHVLPTGDANSGIESGSGPESKTCAKVTQTFTIDCSKTGEAPAMVVPHECLGKVELVEVKHREDGKHQVERSPSTDGSHTLEVTHADEDEYRRPFHFRALSLHAARKVRVGGPGLVSGLPASMPVRFSVDPAEAGEGQLSVEIVDPEGRSKKARIHDNNDGTYEVSYVPSKVGGYKITIKYNGDEIPTSPYHVWATATGDANKCIVTGPKLGSVIGAGKEISFVVNTQSAGMGKVSCFVLTPDGTEVEADVIEREDGTFEICYIANKEGNYIISAGFGGERLFSSPFEVVMTHGSYIPLRSVDQTNGLMPFDIVMAFGLAGGKIMGEVQMPSGSRAQAEVTDNKDGTVTLMYDPIEEGLHQLHIKVNGTTVSESPLQFYVNNASNRELMAHGPGLVYGVSNEIAAFTVFNKDLVQGELDIALEGPSKTEIRCLNNKDGICTVTYLPTVPGDYNIFVRYNDKDIQGSPFTAKIAGDVSRLSSQLRFGTVADFSLDITEEDISLLSASIVSPSGQDVSCILKTQPDNHLGISFIPKEVGKHLVSVLKDGEHVADSPIPLTITPLEIGDANRVKVLGSGLAKGCTFETSSFVVDTREAGYGGLTLAIEGPSNVEIQTEEKEDGTCGVSFCPTEAGTYIVSVKFTDEHVPGSPFKAVVTESGHLRESITHYQGAATIANVGNTCEINLKIPGLDLQHISADVSSPSGSIKEATVTIIGCDIYSVSFLPEERGTHAVSVHYKGQPIPGGPYRYTVGPLGEGGPEKVQAWGQGLQSAKTSIPADFSIWSREAGAGSLSVTMDGPGKAELGFEDRKDGSCGISYIVTNPGTDAYK